MESPTGTQERLKSELSSKVRNRDPCVQLKEIRGKSAICGKFARIECDGVDTDYAACRTCAVPVKYTSDSGTSGLIRHRCPTAPSPEKAKLPPGVKTRLAAKVARMCWRDLRPPALADGGGGGFADVARELLVIGARFGRNVPLGELLPSASAVSRHLREEYDRTKRHVVDELRQVIFRRWLRQCGGNPTLVAARTRPATRLAPATTRRDALSLQCQGRAVSTDVWTEARGGRRYLTLRAHYVRRWRPVARVLATRELLGAEDVERTAGEILQEFGIPSEDVVFVTDGGPDAAAAFRDRTAVSCAGRNITSILREVFEALDEKNPLHGPVVELLAATKNLVGHLRSATLEEELEPFLQQAAETRWHSKLATLKWVDDALKCGKLYDVLLARNQLRFLDDVDAALLGDVVALLTPFDEAARHLSSDAPTLHLVLPTKATLLKGLLRCDEDSLIVTELKAKLTQALDSRFQIHLYHKAATALCPGLRSFLRKSVSVQDYEEVIGTLARLTEKLEAPQEAALGRPPATEVSALDDFFAACMEAGDEEEEEEEEEDRGPERSWGRHLVQHYMSEKIAAAHSLLDFWKDRSGALVPVAKKVLAIPATSAPPVRCFNVAAGGLAEERRATLQPENVDVLLFLHGNM
ncbi:E3 SUMO-protein ligase ZBED1-like isoform X1 [Syngnathoides biaculeatus]|uniref:E3 SUMO-protein ligase ZBED1-like isoform X1 n=1 Tax=Syngnathoides biaculeatus TaxID=300417 RepID=UPI002ADDAF4E|nr:E3 SUMO-protein ligase ZBED1-like isoform X1 [Syngnathoides biaculeatus]